MVRTSNCLLNGKIHEWLKDLSSPWWEWEEEEPSQGAHLSRMGRDLEVSSGSKTGVDTPMEGLGQKWIFIIS